MHKILLLVIMIILTSVWSLVGAQDSSEVLSVSVPRSQESIPVLRDIWRISADNIYPSDLAEQFDSRTFDDFEALLRSSDDLALADTVNPFLDSLGISHTRFYDQRHQTYYMLRSLFTTRDLDSPTLYTVGVQLDEYDPGVVRAVMEGSPAAAAGIRRADRIIEVDNVPFESLLQWQKPTSTKLVLRRLGAEVEVSVTPVFQSFHRALARATRQSSKLLECGDRSIGYLHLWSGTHPVFLEALKDSVANATKLGLDGFILDLRDGYGGAWWEYLDPFYLDRNDYFSYATRDAQGTSNTIRPDPQTNENAWAGALAVIINEGTRSGKESLAYQFKQGDRATLFGTTTAGAFTAGLGVFADRDADYILYLSVQETILNGTVIEGVGVSPDVAVADDFSRDSSLEAALSHLGC